MVLEVWGPSHLGTRREGRLSALPERLHSEIPGKNVRPEEFILLHKSELFTELRVFRMLQETDKKQQQRDYEMMTPRHPRLQRCHVSLLKLLL